METSKAERPVFYCERHVVLLRAAGYPVLTCVICFRPQLFSRLGGFLLLFSTILLMMSMPLCDSAEAEHHVLRGLAIFCMHNCHCHGACC